MTPARMRPALAAALALALLAATGCGGGEAPPDQAEPAPPRVPAAYARHRVVYSVAGSSFYQVELGSGEPSVVLNAEGQIEPSMFSAWIPERDELVFEAASDGRKDLWRFAVGGEPEMIAKDVRGAVAVRGGEALYGSRGSGAKLFSYDLEAGKATELLEGEALGGVSRSTSAPTCFTVETSDPRGRRLYLLDLDGSPTPVADVTGARSFGTSFARDGRVAYVELEPGAGAFGKVRLWEPGGSEPVDLAEEGQLLDMAEDGSVLIRRNLRGGVSGVQRSLVTYEPSASAEANRPSQQLGAYVGALHAVAFVTEGKVLLSQRIEGSNRLELYDLGTQESILLEEDENLQVTDIRPLGEDAALCIRTRPGAQGGAEGEAPSIVSLEDEILFVPLSSDDEPVVIASTTSGALRLLGVFPPVAGE